MQPRCLRDLTPRRVREREPVKERLVVPPPPPPTCWERDGVREQVECVFVEESAYGYLWTSGWVNTVVTCESGWDPGAYNPAGYYGLFQLSAAWIWKLQAYGYWGSPVPNARMAVYVLGAQGRSAWSCSPW